MSNKLNKTMTIDQIVIKAQKVFLTDPLNEEAKNLFIKSYRTKLLRESDEKFDLFGLAKQEFSDEDLKKIELVERKVDDPPFGMKASICFGSLNQFYSEIINEIENENISEEMQKTLDIETIVGPYIRQKGKVDITGTGTQEKTGEKQLKYAGAMKDYTLATDKRFNSQKLRPVAYKISLTDDDKEKIKQKVQLAWIPFDRSKMANTISTKGIGGQISATGAGELEFIARMFYACSKNLNEALPISGKIDLQAGYSASMVKKQETDLINLGNGIFKSKIADRCKSILETYMILATENLLKPDVRYEHLQEFAYEGVQKAINKLIGIDQVSDEISEGKYDFSQANVGAWIFKVARNFAIDKLKQFTRRIYDNKKAAEWVYSLEFPYSIESRLPFEQAKGSFKDTKEVENPKTGRKQYYYIYDDKVNFLKDLQTANGFYYDVDEQDPSKRGRKKIYQKNNPLYFGNLDPNNRGQFMTTITKEIPDYSGEQADKTGMEVKEAQTIKLEIFNICKEIVDRITQEFDKDKYGQAKINSFLKFNKDLAANIIFRMLNYGGYKFVAKETRKEKTLRLKNKELPYGTYDWKTKPEEYIDEFIDSLNKNENFGQGLPASVKSKFGTEMPIREFVQLLRKILLGSGTAGPELKKSFLTGKGETEEFQDLLSKIKTKGFLLQNPSYIRRILSLLSQIPSYVSLDENRKNKKTNAIEKIKNLIQELKMELKNYNLNLYNKNILKND